MRGEIILQQKLCCFLSTMMSVLLPFEALCAPPQQAVGGINGVVREEKGAVVPEARVTLMRQGSQREEHVRSGAVGEFVFQPLPEGDYIVTVVKPGFALLRLEGIVVKPGQLTEIRPVLSNNIRSQLLSIPVGEAVKVKLKQKASKKITGKLGPITDEGFEIQTVKAGVVSSEQIAFADVESVEQKMSTFVKVVIVGGLVFVLLVLGAAFSGLR